MIWILALIVYIHIGMDYVNRLISNYDINIKKHHYFAVKTIVVVLWLPVMIFRIWLKFIKK